MSKLFVQVDLTRLGLKLTNEAAWVRTVALAFQIMMFPCTSVEDIGKLLVTINQELESSRQVAW